MPGQAFGLYTHQRNNRIRSGFLIAGLFLLVYLTSWGLMLVGSAMVGVPRGRSVFDEAWRLFWSLVALHHGRRRAWVFVGFRINVGMIGADLGAQGVSREENPKLYRMLENLCISRGLTMPKLAIVESEALNAFASGVNDKQFTVTVTRGLLDQLNDAEVEAVLAHELTHIRNGDVRLMIDRGRDRRRDLAGRRGHLSQSRPCAGFFRRCQEGQWRRDPGRIRGDRSVLAAGRADPALAVALARISGGCGAVELTKNPDAMISALLKIAGRADIDGVPSGVMDMCFENDPDDFADLFSTHPSITKRVQALVETAGGRMPAMPPHPPKLNERQTLPNMVEESAARGEPTMRGPWARPPGG
jgi:heat shock protein HtpX